MSLPGDRRPENICVPAGHRHIHNRRNCTTESLRPKTKCDDGTLYVSATGATPGESVREYVTVLHELVANCNFGQLSDELIRDQLIEKTNNPRVRERLLMEPDTLTLEKAIILTSRIEVVVKESLSIKKSETRATDSTKFEAPRVQAVRAKSQYSAAKLNSRTHTATNTRVQVPCGNCGYSSHATGSAKCPARAKTCRLCSKMNHFAKFCRSSRKGSAVGQIQQPNESAPFVLSVNSVTSASKPFKTCNLQLADTIVTLIIYIGAKVSILNDSFYWKHFSAYPLHPPEGTLSTYNSSEIPLEGMVHLPVT